MSTLLYLIQKEFIQIRRNSFLPKLIFGFPIVIMCVMPWVMNMEIKNVVVEVVDNDHSQLSSQLIQKIRHSNYFVFAGTKPSYDTALKDIEHSKADVVLVIPQGYEKNGEQIMIAANAVNGTKGAMGSAYLTQIVNSTNASQSATYSTAKTQKLSLGSKLQTLYLYNKNLNYKVFMIPALFAVVIMLMCGFLPTLNIVSEKEAGTIEQINVTPVKKWQFIIAKIIPYWLIAFFIVSVCLVLSWAIYGIVCKGSIWLIYLLVMLLALVFSSFGLIVSNYSDNMQQAIFVMWFFVVILLLLSGLFTPTRSMPDWAYMSTYINPMHYFIDAMRTVFVRGGGLANVSTQISALAIIGCLMAFWAVGSYKKNA